MLLAHAFYQIQLEHLAGIGVGGGCFPVSMVVTAAQVLEIRTASRVFLDLIRGTAAAARLASYGQFHAGEVQAGDRAAVGIHQPPLERNG